MANSRNKKQSVPAQKSQIDELKGKLSQIKDPEVMAELLQAVPEQTRMVVTQRIFSGPLPPAEELQRYEQACSGAAQTIIDMATKEQDHRHSCDDKFFDTEMHCRKYGLWIGAAIMLACMYFSYCLLSSGHLVFGSIFGSVSLFAVVVAFLSGGKQTKRADKNNKTLKHDTDH